MLILLLAACGGVASEEDAEAAYFGLDGAVQRALALGLRGYSQASSANISEQQEDGDTSGTLTVSGQVDQGSSDNKGLRLDLMLDEYSDTLGDDGEPDLVYQTEDPAALDLQLKNIPDGTLSGTLNGTFFMDGALEGPVALALSFAGTLADDGAGGVQAAEGTTAVTGTATSDYGTYEVDVER